jgi:hypothetical protein
MLLNLGRNQNAALKLLSDMMSTFWAILENKKNNPSTYRAIGEMEVQVRQTKIFLRMALSPLKFNINNISEILLEVTSLFIYKIIPLVAIWALKKKMASTAIAV